jgi:DNA invertase Pin-like site-specific DNA recombinase
MSIIEEHGKRESYIEEVAAYIRVSTTEQKLHGISLAAQKKKLQDFADENNMKIVEWYQDEGVSGRKLIKNRPELQRMIQDAEQRKFRRIIFIKLDRFFRSVAEYHECMKRLSVGGVIWTATEEKYDLSTASGEAFVNMKLTMAQFEADQDGERIRMVNEYKIQTGQPLFGSQCLPFCYTVGQPEEGERHKYIEKRDDDIMRDLIDHVMTNHSVRAGMIFINQKYGRDFMYNSVMNALKNEMICGTYKGNPNYCEPYITREEFNQLQRIISRNPRTTERRTYIFTGLIRCPHCGNRLSGGKYYCYSRPNKETGKREKRRSYLAYKCTRARINHQCDYNNIVQEYRLEEMLLDQLESIVENKKIQVISVKSSEEKVLKHDIEALTAELDRLNYAWQKGRIKSVEEYDKSYDSLMDRIHAAEKEQSEHDNEPDYEKIQSILTSGWKEIYKELDGEHKRSFWRSIIEEIHVVWSKDEKRIMDIIFF